MSARDPAGITAATEFLFAQKAHGAKFGIDRMARFSEELGHPERGLPCLHIAGTNGKGSVAAMIESILCAAGWRTGLFTSPHLVKPGERVQVDRLALTDAELMDYVAELRPLADRVAANAADDRPSFFEFMTAMAFLQFTRKRCDVAVLEVGLGGRLDATNVVIPEVSVITSIGLDHCEILGETLEQIAAEKGGIVKPDRPVVLGRMPPAAEDVIREMAAQRRAPVISVAERFGDNLANYPTTNLEGDYQRWNAATAMLAVQSLPPKWQMGDDVIRRGLARVAWPGRWQRLQVAGRLLVLDASHNPEGAQVLEASLARLVAETGRAPVVITGALGTARARPLIETICRHAARLHLVVPHQPRACSHAEMEALVPADFRGKVIRDAVANLFPAAGQCRAGAPDDVIVVTGSIYLLGEVLARFSRPE
ncbi:MAG: bifunctional folylpolyglutamate synthase/dihydrofolate synthase [Opitutus sp.]|nr:bifunctional folylpolyglutamate synthase/dihydrofolate synthase [Opitutus sp.]